MRETEGSIVSVHEARVGRDKEVPGFRGSDARVAEVRPGGSGRVPHDIIIFEGVPAADGNIE